MCNKRLPRPNGFSLIELVLSIVIVGAGLAAMLLVFVSITRSSVDPLIRKQELAIAESMMEEVQLKPFNNPVGGFTTASPSAANRALFDNVGDYSGYNVLGIYAMDGTPIPALSAYRTTVAVAGVALGPAAAPVPVAASLRITVTVTGPGGEALSLVGYRTNYF